MSRSGSKTSVATTAGGGRRVGGLRMKSGVTSTILGLWEAGLKKYLESQNLGEWDITLDGIAQLQTANDVSSLVGDLETNGIILLMNRDHFGIEQFIDHTTLIPFLPDEIAPAGVIGGDLNNEGTQYSYVVIVIGNQVVMPFIIQQLANVWSTTLVFPANQFDQALNTGYSEPSLDKFLATQHFIVTGHTNQILSVLQSGNVDLISKALSVMRLLFPWTKGRLTKLGYNISIQQLNDIGRTVPVVADMRLDEIKTTNFQLYATVLMLMSAYSRPTEFPKQLTARFKALKASYQSTVPQGVDVASCVGNLGVDVQNRNSILFEAAGYWLSINKECDYEEYLTVEKLADPITLKEKGILPHHFPMALMQQGRLVYEYCGMTTAKWALSVAIRLDERRAALTNPWVQEINIVLKNKEIIESFPYTALRITQHEAIQTMKFPRLSALGVLVHQGGLDDAGRKQMDNYVTTNFYSNLNSEDTATIKTYAQILKVGQDEVLVRVIQTSTINEAQRVLANVTDTTIEKIKRILFQSDNMGPWASEQYEIEQANYAGVLATQMQNHLTNMFNGKSSSEQMKITFITDPVRRADAQATLLRWQDEVRNAISNILPAEYVILARSPYRFPKLKENMGKTLAEIIATIQALSL